MELSLNELVIGLVAGSMLLVLLFAFISRGHRLGGLSRATARMVVCRLCLHTYEQQDRSAVSECPMCGARNQRRQDRVRE